MCSRNVRCGWAGCGFRGSTKALVEVHKRREHQRSALVGGIQIPRASDGRFYCPSDGCTESNAMPQYLQAHFRVVHMPAPRPSPTIPRMSIEVVIPSPRPAHSVHQMAAVQTSDDDSRCGAGDADVNSESDSADSYSLPGAKRKRSSLGKPIS